MKDDAFHFESIAAYFNNKEHSEDDQVLSDSVCRDLDIDLLYSFIDRTTSRVGQQVLYNKLRCLPDHPETLAGREKLIEQLTSDKEFRLNLQKELLRLESWDTFYLCKLFQEGQIKPPSWFPIVPFLSIASLVSIIGLFFRPGFFFVFMIVGTVNMMLHYRNKRNLAPYLASLPRFFVLYKVARIFYKFKELKAISPNLAPAFRAIALIRRKAVWLRVESKARGDIDTIIWLMLEFVKILFLLEPIMFFSILRRIKNHKKEIESLFEFVGEVDCLLSIASLRKGLKSWCLPTFHPDKTTLRAVDVYHPLIPDCICNSIETGNKSVLLTGSNMSGKTSFIRTIGISVITGCTLHTCFADSFEMAPFRVYSAIRISDDLLNDRSYYFQEVMTIKEMIDRSNDNKPNLFLLDEIFKGTNTVERISAGKAVLSSLAKSGNLVMVSTHDIELTDLLKDEYALYHFSEQVDDHTVDFDYLLRSGKVTDRNAIRILEINNYPPSVISEAFEIAKTFDRRREDGVE